MKINFRITNKSAMARGGNVLNLCDFSNNSRWEWHARHAGGWLVRMECGWWLIRSRNTWLSAKVWLIETECHTHITPFLSHNFPHVHSKQSTTSRLFNLWTLLTMQLLTYKDVSVCKLSHMRTCLFATCHLISHVLSRLPCFHTNVSPTRRVLAHVRTLQDECLHTFWLTKRNI